MYINRTKHPLLVVNLRNGRTLLVARWWWGSGDAVGVTMMMYGGDDNGGVAGLSWDNSRREGEGENDAIFLDKQVGDMSTHDKIYVTPSHIKKVFGNMKRVGKGFSRDVTPLFPTIMVQAHEEMGEGSANPTDPHHTPTIIQPSTSQPQKKQKLRKPKRKDTKIPQSSSPTEPIADEAANEENVPTHSNDLLLSGEDRLKLEELMALCTNLQNIVGLSARIDSSNDEVSLGDQEDTSKQGRKIHDIDEDENITLASTHFDTDPDMFIVHDLEGDEVFVEAEEPVVNAATTTSTILVSAAKDLSDVDMTLVQALAKLKNTKPKEQASTPITPSNDKGKGIMVEEPLKMKKKDQVLFDQQEAIRLQAQFDKEERIAREKEEANATLIAQWNDIQDKVETDYELAQRLQAEEQEELNDAEKATLFVQLLEKRRKYFAAKRTEETRNRPPTKAQQRSIMCTYLKNMAGWKPKDLKNKPFATIQDLFDKAMKRVNTFVDMDTELLEGGEVREEGNETREESSSKRAGDELESDKSKKQKLNEKVEAEVDDAKEAKELKQCLEIVPDNRDDVTIDAIPLSVKTQIVDYKIQQEGKKSFFQIIRADGNSQMYLTFTKMLKNFDREDLEVLWKIVKARFKKTESVNYMDNFLLLNLKTMFEHHVEDGSIPYYLLVEKMYLLTKHTLHQMFNDVKLQVDYEYGMAYELLRLVKKQLKEGYVPE
ncbi:hypothetical protein Tco_0519877 [Tanacetum coccineum]